MIIKKLYTPAAGLEPIGYFTLLETKYWLKINIRIGLDLEFKLYSIGKKKSITAVAGNKHLTEFATISCIRIPFVKPAKNGDDHVIRKTVFKIKLICHLSCCF